MTTIDLNHAEAIGTDLASTTGTLVDRLAVVQPITDLAGLERAVRDRTEIGGAIARVEEFFADPIAMAHRLHKTLCDRRSTILAPLRLLDGEKKQAIAAFKLEEDRRRQAEERRLAEERRAIEAERVIVEAALLERDGETAMATAVIEEALAAPAPVVALPDVTKGIAKFVRRWTWRYVGGPAEIARTPPEVVERVKKLIPAEFLLIDEKKIGAYARSMKASGRIPGIEIYSVDDPVR